MIFAVVLGFVMTQILYRRKINDVGAENLIKITAVGKKLKTASFSNDLLQDENIDHAGKLKSPPSSAHPSE